MYETFKTSTRIQGIRNSAYNGMSCVLLGLLSLRIPGDIVDYRKMTSGRENMKNRLENLYRNIYKTMMYFVIVNIFIAFLAKYLKKKNY